MNDCICTVLLISYNHRPFIRTAIESVLVQKTDYRYKIHIFDDASSDGTGDVVREYGKKYPHLITPFIAGRNAGAAANFERAYRSVDTKYCAILECDDFWCDEKKLQLQIDAMEQNPDCSFCAHNTLYNNKDDAYRRKEHNTLMVTNRNVRNTGRYRGDDFTPLYGAGWMNHSNSRLIRMSLVDLDALVDKEDFFYDNCQFFYLLSRGNLYYVQRVMSVYRMNMAGAFTSLQVQKKISGHFSRLLHVNESTNGEYERMIYRHLGSFARYWLNLDDLEQGIIKKHMEVTYLLMRSLKKLLLDTWPHHKLKVAARPTIKHLQGRDET